MAGGGEVRANAIEAKAKPMKKGGKVECFAMGGVGKIKKDVMTPAGKPIAQKKKRV